MRLPLYYISVLLVLFCPLSLLYADEQNFFDIEADEIVRDETLSVVTLLGNVVAQKQQKTLKADKMIYHEKDERLVAIDNVVFIDGDYTYKGNYLELDGEFKDVIITKLYASLGGNSTVWAESFTRKDARYNILDDASFTTCNRCDDGSYLWTVSANEVIHDTTEKNIEYYDAIINFAGIPVFYTPYFRQPDPTVKRQSGITDFGFGTEPSVGFYVAPEYFQIIDEYSDVTFAPIFSATHNLIPQATYRRFLEAGEIYVSGAYVNGDDGGDNSQAKENDYFIKVNAIKDLNHEWRTGVNYEHITRRDFYRNYTILGARDNFIKNEAYAEGFLDQNYARYDIARYNDLRNGDKRQPINIAPHVTIDGIGLPSTSGGRWRLYGDARQVRNKLNGWQDALHMDGGYIQPFVFDNGVLFTIDGGIKSSVISSGFSEYSDRDGVSDTITRAVPELNMAASYPLSYHSDNGQTIIEPRVSAYVSSLGGNNPNIYNVDTSQLELNSSNIFTRNRLSGYSFVETGPRSSYGMSVAHYLDDGRFIDVFLGQSHSYKESPFLKRELGIDNSSSDYLLDLRSTIIENVSLNQYLVYDTNRGNISRLRLDATYDYDFLRAGLNYTYFKAGSDAQPDNVKQLVPFVTFRVSDYVSLGMSSTQNYQYGHRKTLNTNSYIQYTDECFTISLSVDKNFTQASSVDNAGYTTLLNFELLGF